MKRPDAIEYARSKVAVVQPILVPGGGTEAVTAWTIESLKNEYDVSLVSFSAVTADALNLYYGTELRDGEFSIVQVNLPPLLKRTSRLMLLKDHLMVRWCKSAYGRFDLFISVGGAMDFGAKGVQYMALAPGSTLVKVLARDPKVPIWYHIFKRAFMRLSEFMSASSQERIRQNVTLVTSKWAGRLIEDLFEIPNYEVVYPPVNGPSTKAPWATREEGFLCVARISPEKQIERAIEILKLVREKGFNISLRIVGRQDDSQYFEGIRRLCEENGSWATLEGPLTREELGGLMDQFKYGINAASDEPFGIALAEMVRAGCIIFVPDSGGQTEIVDEPQLIYSGIDDAVNKITNVLNDSKSQEILLKGLEGRGEIFSTQEFCNKIQSVVHESFGNG